MSLDISNTYLPICTYMYINIHIWNVHTFYMHCLNKLITRKTTSRTRFQKSAIKLNQWHTSPFISYAHRTLIEFLALLVKCLFIQQLFCGLTTPINSWEKSQKNVRLETLSILNFMLFLFLKGFKNFWVYAPNPLTLHNMAKRGSEIKTETESYRDR